MTPTKPQQGYVERAVRHGWRAARDAGGWLRPRLAALPPGPTVMVLVLLLVSARALWVHSIRPEHRREIASAYGTVGLFYSTPQASPDGTRLTFARQSQEGVGVFLHEIETGETRTVWEHRGKPPGEALRVWPWAPDGAAFAFSTPEGLMISSTNKHLDPSLLKVKAHDFAWVNATTFACLAARREAHLYRRTGYDRTTGSALWAKTVLSITNAVSIAPAGTNALAVGQQQRVRIVSIDAPEKPALLLRLDNRDPKNLRLVDMDRCPETGKWLLTCARAIPSLWQFDETVAGAQSLRRVTGAEAARGGKWLPGGHGGYAWLAPKGERNVLLVKEDDRSAPQRLFTLGDAQAFTVPAKPGKVFILGTVSNEPSAGIWSYNIYSEDIEPIVPCADEPSPYARNNEPRRGSLKLKSGRRIHFDIYRPVELRRGERGQKFPVLIGSTYFGTDEKLYQSSAKGPLWVPAIAACGGYVVNVERKGWWTDLDKWEENVLAICEELFNNPTIDRERVYLFGASAETAHISKLVMNQPERWKGVILLNPGMLPDFSTLARGSAAPRMLISLGELEKGETRLQRFQTDAMRYGAPVEYVIHKGETHWLQSKASVLERTQAMIRFIFEDAI